MDESAKVAFLNSQIFCAQAKLEGMKVENASREREGSNICYHPRDFYKIASQYGLEHNQVLSYLMDI